MTLFSTPSEHPLRSVSFAVIDFETTGINPQKDRILQMAAVIVTGAGEVIHSFDTVVKPEQPEEYEHGAEHIHGISREHVAHGMPLSEALEKLWSLSEGHVITAHNARFDIGFLHAETQRMGMSQRVNTFLDTLTLARRADTEKTRKHSLGALCQHYGIELDHAHHALADATATAQLLLQLLTEMGIDKPEQISQLLS